MTTPRGIERSDSNQNQGAEFAIENLKRFKERFDPALNVFLQNAIADARSLRPELAQIMDVGANFALEGGKRLRPAFLYFGYKAGGGMNDGSAIIASTSVELIHTGALVHDDIIDHSDLRRGNPTVHISFNQMFGQSGMGEGLAILTGDTIAALASKALSSFPDKNGVEKARGYFDEMCLEINMGQYLDLLGNTLEGVDPDLIMKVMEYKTARYTIQKPLLIGASLAGAKQELLDGLSNYAIPLGIAFQLQDDILGMFGNEKKVGKPVDSDLKEGKKTLLVFYTTQRLEQKGAVGDLARFKKILGNPDLTNDDYLWVQNLIIDTGALESCRKLAGELIDKSKQGLKGININPEAKEYLLGIAEYMLAREY